MLLLTWVVLQVTTAQASHLRHLGEAAQLRQELRQLSTRLELAESDQQHLQVTCKQATATAEAEWATKVSAACYLQQSRLLNCSIVMVIVSPEIGACLLLNLARLTFACPLWLQCVAVPHCCLHTLSVK